MLIHSLKLYSLNTAILTGDHMLSQQALRFHKKLIEALRVNRHG